MIVDVGKIMKKKKRALIKKECRKMEILIRKNNTNDNKIKDTINDEMGKYFGFFTYERDTILGEKIPTHQFSVDNWICDSDLYSHNRMIFINFYKKEKVVNKAGIRVLEIPSKFIKRLSLANFIFTYCNPEGLIILEKIMFQLS
jgi:hypothetical protein